MRLQRLEVRTGAFWLAPLYAAKPGSSGNHITGWQGRAELMIESKPLPPLTNWHVG